MGRSRRRALSHGPSIRKRITSIEDLKEEALHEADFALLLRYGLFSRKTIHYDGSTEIFSIWHHIDDTHEELTEAELEKRNIGKAIRKRAFVKLEESE